MVSFCKKSIFLQPFQPARLSLRNITATFLSIEGPEITLFSGLSFDFEPGVVYGITGPSGSGKSTFLQIVGGVQKQTTGELFWQNRVGDQKDSFVVPGQFGFVFQQPLLIDELSVLENVMVQALFDHKIESDCFERGLMLLDKIGLVAYASSHPKVLSIGQRQRVCLARALYKMPKFLLLDEPTAGLDRHNSDQIILLLKGYCREQNAGVIIATHDPLIINAADVLLDLSKN